MNSSHNVPKVVDDFRFYKEGVYSSDKCGNGPTDVNHAVLAVGYGTCKKVISPKIKEEINITFSSATLHSTLSRTVGVRSGATRASSKLPVVRICAALLPVLPIQLYELIKTTNTHFLPRENVQY